MIISTLIQGLIKFEKWFPNFNLINWKKIYFSFVISTILDPRFKNKTFNSWGLKTEDIEDINKEFINLFEK